MFDTLESTETIEGIRGQEVDSLLTLLLRFNRPTFLFYFITYILAV